MPVSEKLALPMPRGHAVQRKHQQAAEQSAQSREQHRFHEKAEQNAAPRKAQHAQRSNLPRRRATAAYMVFMAAKLLPTAMMIATMMPVALIGPALTRSASA